MTWRPFSRERVTRKENRPRFVGPFEGLLLRRRNVKVENDDRMRARGQGGQVGAWVSTPGQELSNSVVQTPMHERHCARRHDCCAQWAFFFEIRYRGLQIV